MTVGAVGDQVYLPATDLAEGQSPCFSLLVDLEKLLNRGFNEKHAKSEIGKTKVTSNEE